MGKPAAVTVTDGDLLKALDELTDSVKKGDRLLEADTEGGLSTQGEPLSKKAPKGVVKADACSDDDSDEASSVGKSKRSGCKHVYKGQMACKSCASSVNKASDDDSSDDSDDDSSDDGSSMGKSLAARVEGDEAASQALQVDVSGFLKSIASEMSDSLDTLRKSVDDRFETHAQNNREFNLRVAKALTMIGNSVNRIIATLATQEKSVQKALGQPVFTQQQRPQLLTPREIVQPTFEDEPRNNAFQSLSPTVIIDYLCEKVQKGDRSVGDVITEYELNGYNPAVFDRYPFVRKSLLQDLCG